MTISQNHRWSHKKNRHMVLTINSKFLTRRRTVYHRTVALSAIWLAPTISKTVYESEGLDPATSCPIPIHEGRNELRARFYNLFLYEIWTRTSVTLGSIVGGADGYVCAAVELFLFATSFAIPTVIGHSITVSYIKGSGNCPTLSKSYYR